MAQPRQLRDWNAEPVDEQAKARAAKNAKGDGKAGIGGSAFNLANAVSSRDALYA